MFTTAWVNTMMAFFWAFSIAVFAVPSILYIAFRRSLFDMPNRRTVHESPIPRLGGIAIFAGFMSSIAIFGKFVALGQTPDGIQELFAGCILIFFVGLKDDLVSVSAFKKLLGQVVAAGIVVLAGDIRLENFYGFLGFETLDYGLSFALSFIIIIGITNAINFIDGLDGLAGSIVLLMTTALGYFFYLERETYSYYIVCACLGGAIIGFLRYNFYKAKIFMGDTGSLVIGFIIAVLALSFVRIQPGNLGDSSPVVVIAILFIPLIDTIRIFIIRTINGLSPFAPDKNHIHHRLLAKGLNSVQVVLLMLVFNLLLIISVVYFSYLDINILMGFIAFLGLIVIVLIELFTPKAQTNA